MGTSGTDQLDDSSKRRGLWKLMLRVPEARGQLQIAAFRENALFDLCAAYDDATAMVEKLRSGGMNWEPAILDEYETICAELEAEALSYCREEGRFAPK